MDKIYADAKPHGWCAECEIQGTEIMGFEELASGKIYEVIVTNQIVT